MTTTAARIPGDVCFADPTHPLPQRVLPYTQDPTTPRAHLAVVCGATCKAAADHAWATHTGDLHLPAIDRTHPTPPPHHEATCPTVCAWCDGRIASKDHT
jgi:hypothetical protein